MMGRETKVAGIEERGQRDRKTGRGQEKDAE